MPTVKAPNVAGTFYPDNSQLLRSSLQQYFAAPTSTQESAPKAIIAPHAGLVYSGLTAAFAYQPTLSMANNIQHIVLIGPSHYCHMSCVAACTADAFATPLGLLASDKAMLQHLHNNNLISFVDQAFEKEHALEVHFPFIQMIFPNVPLTALVAGQNTATIIHDILLHVWQPQNTLVIVSSDLSHFHPYAEAKQRDKQTANAILNCDTQHIQSEDACGAVAINGLLLLAKDKGLQAKLLDLRNSGDTAGDPARVVGYGAFQFV